MIKTVELLLDALSPEISRYFHELEDNMDDIFNKIQSIEYDNRQLKRRVDKIG